MLLLHRLAAHTSSLPDAGVVAFLDVDSMQRRTPVGTHRAHPG
ncbi:hypothetical protein ACFHYQ_04685 [Sphaerimonospora cavernae]|uniref:Uncharacterized protein n=1 Tax=Sphaerimonospora cavernae TaxID=1740611 RepID=A0ABV6U361_9ACTN